MKGIALEGGSSRGAYQMGVMKALYEKGYKFDVIAGTSIGAFNAAMIAQGDFEICYKLWENMQPGTLFDIENERMEKIADKGIDRETVVYLSSEAKKIIENRGIGVEKLRKVIDEYIDEEKLRKSDIDFGLVTVKLDGIKPVPIEILKKDIPEGELKDYIMASANLPFFKTEALDGNQYLDGGFYDKCPVQLLERAGCNEILAIRLTPDRKLKEPLKKSTKVKEIKSNESLGRGLIFTNHTLRDNISRGYFDMIREYEELKGRKYYIRPIDDNEFLKRVMEYPDYKMNELLKNINTTGMNNRRFIFEKIVPMICNILKIDESASYQDIFIILLEELASERNIEQFRIYGLEEFVEKIRSIKSEKQTGVINNIKDAALNIIRPIEKFNRISLRGNIMKEFEKRVTMENQCREGLLMPESSDCDKNKKKEKK